MTKINDRMWPFGADKKTKKKVREEMQPAPTRNIDRKRDLLDAGPLTEEEQETMADMEADMEAEMERDMASMERGIKEAELKNIQKLGEAVKGEGGNERVLEALRELYWKVKSCGLDPQANMSIKAEGLGKVDIHTTVHEGLRRRGLKEEGI